GGPTGVELAGAVAGIARLALAQDFKAIDTTKARVMLFEGSDRVLGTFAKDLSASAKEQLEDLGVEVQLNSFVTDIEPGRVKVGENWIECDVVLWATGVAASPIGKALGVETDNAGRVFVQPDLTIPGFKNIFVIGDMASLKQANGEPVPGLSPAAMQMGNLTAANIVKDLKNEPRKDFTYVDKGTMATIGRSKAIADVQGLHFTGFIAWLMWLFLHVIFLIGFRNRIYVLMEWFWAYLSRERSARLITGDAEELKDALKFLGGNSRRAKTGNSIKVSKSAKTSD
ncbi:MAG: FAD-dependent oxidoreductase, partial [Pyrinomonadaceae bacterium]